MVSTIPRAEQPADCPAKDPAIQVLGSGGPIAEFPPKRGGARAGASYLFWIDGEPRLLIDAGAGSFLRFAEAGGKITSLDAILISHHHADHTGDLAGILNSGGFEGRTKPLPVIGPAAAPRFPSTEELLRRLLDKESGAFAHNGGYLDGTENKPLLQPRSIPTDEGAGPSVGLDISNDYSVMAHPVHHGPAPTLAFVIEIGGKSVILASDQSFLSERFVTELAGSKPMILMAHHVINGEPGQPRGLHRTPEQIGEMAKALEPERLVLSHNMERSLSRLDEGLKAIGRHYSGAVSVTADLDCYAL
ncbi:MAG: MBL fold metallo-hydrolase [Erythrobacter sp.]|nr:MBL fold metallo-hydrolase [Erythrobacter sp.]